MVSKVTVAISMALYIALAVAKSSRVGELNSGNAEVTGLARAQCDCSGDPFHYNCSGKEDGNYPHPSDCTMYVACVAETEAWEMPCATGLRYVADSGPDPSESFCDYPENVQCACDCSAP